MKRVTELDKFLRMLTRAGDDHVVRRRRATTTLEIFKGSVRVLTFTSIDGALVAARREGASPL